MKVLCSVYDQKARVYSAPFLADTEESAVRDFARAVVDAKLLKDKFPADYELCLVGQFDESEGTLLPVPFPQSLAKGAEYLESK